jgi:N-acetyl sugar amidotransferase
MHAGQDKESQRIFCKRCLFSSAHPLLLEIDDEGLCTGCRIHEEKDRIDWNDKLEELRKLLVPYRSKTGKEYECIVPVCGGKDSYFVVHAVTHILKLKPLLVSYNRLYNTRVGLRNLEQLRNISGCDLITQTPNPKVNRLLIQASIEKLGNIHWPYLAGSTAFPVQIAARYNIPLIIWGAHQGIDQVGMFSHHDMVEMTRKYRKEHDLMGYEPEDLIDSHPHFTEKNLSPFYYPSDKILYKHGIRGIYLNNYFRWDSKKQHEDMIRLYGYLSAYQDKTFDTYNEIHCAAYMNIHDRTRIQKHGYGKVSEHICREIRLGRLNRKQGRILENYYLAKKYHGITDFIEWLELSEKSFNRYIDTSMPQKKNYSPDFSITSEYTEYPPESVQKLIKKLNFIIGNEPLEFPELNPVKQFPIMIQGGSEVHRLNSGDMAP